MTNFSQQQPINISKPFLSADKVSLSCIVIGQNVISILFCVFLRFPKFALHFVIL